MAGKLLFVTGVAIGYVLGSRAGREKFDRMAGTVRKVAEDPAVRDAIGVVQSQARRVYADSRAAIVDKLNLARADEDRDQSDLADAMAEIATLSTHG